VIPRQEDFSESHDYHIVTPFISKDGFTILIPSTIKRNQNICHFYLA
jgi:hypothetical protein